MCNEAAMAAATHKGGGGILKAGSHSQERYFVSPLLQLQTLPPFQVIYSSECWQEAPRNVRKNLESLVEVVLKSLSDSTTKTYKRGIRTFFSGVISH